MIKEKHKKLILSSPGIGINIGTAASTKNNDSNSHEGQPKKRKKRLTKSQRKKRKRERLLLEQQQKQQEAQNGSVKRQNDDDDDDDDATINTIHNQTVSHLQNNKVKSQNNHRNGVEFKKEQKSQHGNKSDENDSNKSNKLDGESKQEQFNTASTFPLSSSSSSSQNKKNSFSIDATNLLEFVYPKQQQSNNHHYKSKNTLCIKPYIHAKLRQQNERSDNNHGDDNVEHITRTSSMDVADETIDDIFSSMKKKQKKENRSDDINKKEMKKVKDISIDDKSAERIDNDNNSDKLYNIEADDESDDDSSAGEDDGNNATLKLFSDTKSNQSYNNEKFSDDDSSSESLQTSQPLQALQLSQSLPLQSIINKTTCLTSIHEDSDRSTEENKPNILTELGKARAHNNINEKDKIVIDSNGLSTTQRDNKKRSMSEDSAQDNFTNSQLSGISIEMAIKDKIGRRPRCNSTDGELNLPRRGLCDEQKVMSLYKWDMDKFRPSPPRGFHNLGNTCFLNATLQCLAHLPTFCQCVANIDPSQTHKFINGNGTTKKLSNGQKITLALRILLQNVHGLNTDGKPKQSPISPKVIVNSISLIDGTNRGYKFRPGRQEDAHEFLVHLLDAMNDGELKAAGINQNKSGWRDRLPIPRLDETTFVHRMFGGYLRSQVCCTNCEFKSNTYDPFLDLSLEVSSKKVNCVYSALKEYTRKETLDAENKWKCSGCKKRVCATKQLTCFRPPLSLCIQLKRFSFGGGMGSFMHHQFGFSHFAGKGMGMMRGGSKIQKRIEFPADLKLPLSDGRCCEYQLTGVVIHVGHTATSGHYTAFVRRQMKNGSQWYHMDDSFVEPVQEKSVLRQRDAYVLFYCRKEVKLNLPNPPSIFGSAQEAINARSKVVLQEATSTSNNNAISTLLLDSQSKSTTVATSINVNPTDLISKKKNTSNKANSAQVLTFNHGSKLGSVQIPMRKRNRNRNVWKPSYLTPNNSGENILLGNTKVSKWDDNLNANDTSFREAVNNEIKQENKNRKRAMYLDSWDAGLDKGRVKKVKTNKHQNQNEFNKQLKPKQNPFHKLQNNMSKFRFRGEKHSLKKRNRR